MTGPIFMAVGLTDGIDYSIFSEFSVIHSNKLGRKS